MLNAPATAALNQYTDFQFVVAKDYSWVVALAATIPCVQVCDSQLEFLTIFQWRIRSPTTISRKNSLTRPLSRVSIAWTTRTASHHSWIAVIDTLWYDQWVLPNLDYSYLEPQIGEYSCQTSTVADAS